MYKAIVPLVLTLCLAQAAQALRPVDTDFDGDGRTDNAVYYAPAGTWYIFETATSGIRIQQFGWSQSEPVPGDFDGDGKADPCVFFNRQGNWYILQSSDGAIRQVSGWGSPELDPIAGDFDGDGISDLALYHPPTGNWYIERSSDGVRYLQNWGWWEAEPVPGDYDGDGKTDVAVHHRATGNWYILQSSTGTLRIQNWGWAETEPVQADYDGDGADDIAVYHPPSGTWYILQSATASLRLAHPGWFNVQPVPAYYDGDAKADIAAYHAQTGNWLMHFSSDQQPHLQNWGWSGAESAFSNYRIDDDGTYYGNPFGHDYDDDTFQAVGQYPRTSGSTVTPGPGGGSGSGAVPADFAGVEWLHTDVSGWSQSSNLRSVSISGSQITLDYDKANVWPGVNHVGAFVNANPWIFVPKEDGSGWYAGTWEWLRQGQTTKSVSSVAGDHIKKSPLQNFRPVSGETYGFMVSGLARDNTRNVQERTQVVMFTWP